jgi:hypothetical protein
MAGSFKPVAKAAAVATDKVESPSNGELPVMDNDKGKGKEPEKERTPFDDSDIDRILAQEATGIQRDEEVRSDGVTGICGT